MRKIEFKAKDINTKKWIFGYYFMYETCHFLIIENGNEIEIEPSTLCQLITEINGVKIFEYDCFVVKNKMYFAYYDETGELILKVVRIDTKNYQYEDKYIEYDFDKLVYYHRLFAATFQITVFHLNR
jgi:hypothetical protein